MSSYPSMNFLVHCGYFLGIQFSRCSFGSSLSVSFQFPSYHSLRNRTGTPVGMSLLLRSLLRKSKMPGSHLSSRGLSPKYCRPEKSLPSCSGWERVFPLSASPPDKSYFPHSRKSVTVNARTPTIFLRKEVIQPHLPIRLPCYDFTPVTDPAVDCSLLSVGSQASGVTGSHGVTGGVYKTRERIHRSMLICDY